MSGGKRRVKEIEGCLTPTQAVCLWLEEAHRLGSVFDYVRWLRRKPASGQPLDTIIEQVEEGVRGAMRGQPREAVDRAVKGAVRDAIFLFQLALQVNVNVLQQRRAYFLTLALLAAELKHLFERAMLSDDMLRAWRQVSQMPYPLDRDASRAVEGAIRHYVETWDTLDELGGVDAWVVQHFVSQGKTELPFGAYLARHGEDAQHWSPFRIPTEEELRVLFGDEADWADFVASRDFSYGLTDVRDAEFEAVCEAVRTAMVELVVSGFVKEGRAVRLESAPNEGLPPMLLGGLREAPLVEGVWIDRHVVELAEWGAVLQKRGCTLLYPDDDHLLAWERIKRPNADGSGVEEMSEQELVAVRSATRANLARFKGRTMVVDGRLYLHFEDYSAWRGRKVKGRLLKQVTQGLVAASWNAWVDAQGGVGMAALAGPRVPSGAGVKVAKIESCLSERDLVCFEADEAARRAQERRETLASLRAWTVHDTGVDGAYARVLPGSQMSYRDEAAEWRDRTEAFLAEVVGLMEAAEAIGRRYLGGHQVLFPDAAADLGGLVEQMEGLVKVYNEGLAAEIDGRLRVPEQREEGKMAGHSGTEASYQLDIEAAKQSARGGVAETVSCLVDMAKAEALSTLGDRAAALALVERHMPD